MNYKDFTKRELSQVLDVIQATLKVKTDKDFTNLMADINQLVCADQGVCGLGEIKKNRLVSITKIINLNYSEKWLSVYGRERLFERDPIIRCQFEFPSTHLWKEAFELFPEETYTDFMRLAADFGLKYGVASGMNEVDLNRGSIFSFSGGVEGHFKSQQKKILDILTPHIHQALVRVCAYSTKPDCTLTEREKEVLKWSKEGKTNWEISMILNISERTVKFHIQNLQDKFKAVSKSHAVAIAMEHGFVA